MPLFFKLFYLEKSNQSSFYKRGIIILGKMEKLILEINFDANLICTIKKYGFFYLPFLFVSSKNGCARGNTVICLKGMIAIPFAFYSTGGELLHIRKVYTNRLSPSNKEPCLSHILPLLSTLTRHHRSSSDARSLLLRTSFSVLLKFIRYTARYVPHVYIRILNLFDLFHALKKSFGKKTTLAKNEK